MSVEVTPDKHTTYSAEARSDRVYLSVRRYEWERVLTVSATRSGSAVCSVTLQLDERDATDLIQMLAEAIAAGPVKAAA